MPSEFGAMTMRRLLLRGRGSRQWACPTLAKAHLRSSCMHSPARHYSTKGSSAPPKQPKPTRRKLILAVSLCGIILYLTSSPSSQKTATLNDNTFVPYTITSRTVLSPSSFVLTVAPQTPNPSPPYLLPGSNRWRHPLWSVEFKQPEVQISRHYTPLPPPAATDEEAGALRFYIRAVGDGEMSRYLNRLRAGQDIHLRGPHVGFDIVNRLGASKNIVFLAGGTGVVPGMQAAKVALDGYEDTKVSLLWAVRKREEVQRAQQNSPSRSWWDFRTSNEPAELEPTLEGPSPVARQLADMKTQYGDRFSVQVVVDDEKTAFYRNHIQKTLTAISDGDTRLTNPGTGCSLHDQQMHVMASEFEAASPDCRCTPTDGSLPGKNLFIVSGPDGFVTHYAGPKIWIGGQQTQGPVGGIAAQIQRQNPQLAHDWLVLKL